MPQSAQVLYEFGPFRLDTSEELLAEGTRKVPLTPKAYKTLLVLVESRGRTLAKDELLRKVWPDAFVEEATLAQNIFTLRKLLRDDRETAQYIETLPKRGYRFVAEVREVKAATAPVQPPSKFAPGIMLYAVILAGVFAAVLGGWYWVRSKPGTERLSPGAKAKPRTLAVLPFRGQQVAITRHEPKYDLADFCPLVTHQALVSYGGIFESEREDSTGSKALAE